MWLPKMQLLPQDCVLRAATTIYLLLQQQQLRHEQQRLSKQQQLVVDLVNVYNEGNLSGHCWCHMTTIHSQAAVCVYQLQECCIGNVTDKEMIGEHTPQAFHLSQALPCGQLSKSVQALAGVSRCHWQNRMLSKTLCRLLSCTCA